MMDLSVIIVSWNVRELLRRCLQSIAASPATVSAGSAGLSYEIIVVDNASSDGSAAMVQSEFPHVRLVVNANNPGFAAANNIGLALAQGRYVLLLNPDTEIVSNALAVLVTYADEHPRLGALGPQLLNTDGSIQSSRRRFPTLVTALFESTWLQACAPRRVLDHYYALDLPDHQPASVDWVTGAALMVRRLAVEQAGSLDENFFMYSEELDWCKRIKAAGWDIAYVPLAQVIHHGGKSSEQVMPQRHIYFQSSKVRYFNKHHGQLAGSFLRVCLLAMYVWQIGLEAGKWLIGNRRALRRERIQAYSQVLQSRLA